MKGNDVVRHVEWHEEMTEAERTAWWAWFQRYDLTRNARLGAGITVDDEAQTITYFRMHRGPSGEGQRHLADRCEDGSPGRSEDGVCGALTTIEVGEPVAAFPT